MFAQSLSKLALKWSFHESLGLSVEPKKVQANPVHKDTD